MMSSGGKPIAGEQLVGALADLDLALLGVGLAGLVERHDHHGGAIGHADLAAHASRNGSSPSFMLIELTIGLPDTHFSPASITLHFELSIITGTRAMSGSAAMRLRKVVIACSPSSSASSMLTSMICAPFSTWSRATSTAAS